MKVRELIGQLQDYDEETDVYFSYNYGDYSRTMVISKVSRVEEKEVIYSAYHRMDRIVDKEETKKEGKTKIVLVLD